MPNPQDYFGFFLSLERAYNLQTTSVAEKSDTVFGLVQQVSAFATNEPVKGWNFFKNSISAFPEARHVLGNIEKLYCRNSCLPARRFEGYSVFLRIKLPVGKLNLGESLALFHC